MTSSCLSPSVVFCTMATPVLNHRVVVRSQWMLGGECVVISEVQYESKLFVLCIVGAR